MLPLLREMLAACQGAADAEQAVERHWPSLAPLVSDGPVATLATGKASVPMLQGTLRMGQTPLAIVITCPPEHTDAARKVTQGMAAQVLACDHPLPTARNVDAAGHVLRWVESLPPNATLLVLLSGGASAHLCLPATGLALEDVASCTRALQRAGADIRALNAVRKHVEVLKGGGLARRARVARVVTCVLSDVLPRADGRPPLDVIASGPTVPDATTYADALEALRAHRVTAPAIEAHLTRGTQGHLPETLKHREQLRCTTHEHVVGDNRMLVDAAIDTLRAQGVAIIQRRDAVEADAQDVGRWCAHAMRNDPPAPGLHAVVVGGEWTVDVGDATGTGGPSQELAVAVGVALESDARPWALLAYSSDGIDGPTDAAGAVMTSGMLASCDRAWLRSALDRHDTHAALDGLGALVRTGPTGTNINHIAALVWEGVGKV